METEVSLLEPALPAELPILLLDEMVVFPYMVVPLSVGEEDSELINAVVAGDRFLGCVMRQPAPEQSSDSEPPLYEVGCAVQLHKMMQMPDESRRILLRGVTRIRIEEFTQVEPYRIARITELEETTADESDEEIQALRQSLLNTFEEITALSPGLPEEAVIQALNVPNLSMLTDLIASALDIDMQTKQKMLEMTDVAERLAAVHKAAHEQLVRLQAADASLPTSNRK